MRMILLIILILIFMVFPETTHFKLKEFHSKDGKKVPIQYYANLRKLMNQLEIIRKEFGGRRIFINSGYRSPEHNATIPNSSSVSQHLTAKAADIVVEGVPAGLVQTKIIELMDSGKIAKGAVGRYASFTHYDIRGTKVIF